jgi:hypothetical protein
MEELAGAGSVAITPRGRLRLVAGTVVAGEDVPGGDEDLAGRRRPLAGLLLPWRCLVTL